MALMLCLTGGISFFSGYHGWACDNVRNYEESSWSIEVDKVRLTGVRSFLQIPQSSTSTTPLIPTSTGLSEAAATTSA